MRFTIDIDIPKQILIAQRTGKLVVFVGAGASCDSPSNLPLFPELVRKIVSDAHQEGRFGDNNLDDKPDRVLGEIQENGVPVHHRIRDIINVTDSHPNRLHHAIAGLFRSVDDVRIVTTNYDRHLESALRDRWFDTIEIYKAPALPLAIDFSGLVYLHGSADQEPMRLVATDQDFGRAYLTEGWAARFVHELFVERTVLFIGYSHNDPVVTYLARGLTRKGLGRFVLAPKNEGLDQWRYLGVELIEYPLRTGSQQEHLALTECIEEWSKHVGMRIREHAEKVKVLCSDPRSLNDPVSESYLADLIENENRVALFAEYAHGPEWVKWVLGHDFVKVFFQTNATLSPANRRISQWLVDETLREPETFTGQTSVLTTGLAAPMWDYLAQQVLQLAKVDQAAADQWIPILLQTASDYTSIYLEFMLVESHWPEDLPKALLLIDRLLDPSTTIPRFQIVNRDRSYSLKKFWQEFFDPNLESCSAALMPIMVRHLEALHRRMAVAGNADLGWDFVSRGRSAIERHEQDSGMLRELDILIDGCRDLLMTLLRSDPVLGRGYLRSFEESEAPLLRRIAVHAWSEREDVSPDARLEWLISRNFVWDVAARHEVFRLVKTWLPSVALSVKQQFLDQVLVGSPVESSDNESNPDIEAYRIFQYLVWITDSDPQFEEATTALLDLQNSHPMFVPDEHADMARWIHSVYTESGLEWSVDDLLSRTPEEVLSNLMSYEDSPGTLFEPGWYNVSALVSEAVRHSPSWGLQMSAALGAAELWRSDLWNSIVEGWNLGILADDAWEEILDVLLAHREPITIRQTTSRLLERGFQRQDVPLRVENLTKAESLARILWATNDEEDDPAIEPNGGWLDGAINEWSGRLALFWIRVIKVRRESIESNWTGLDDELREVLSKLISGNGRKHAFARTIVASELAFLHFADTGWTTEYVIPLFDWEHNCIEAHQAWDGFLGNPYGLSQPLLSQIMPFYLQSVARGANGPCRRDLLLSNLASLAFDKSIHKFGRNGWLDKMVAGAGNDDLKKWAASLTRALKTTTPSAEPSFAEWILEYWRRRIAGIPTALSAEEAFEMLDWVLFADAKFPDVVELLCQTHIKRSKSHRIFVGELVASGMAHRFPAATAQLLNHVLHSLNGPVVAHREELKSLFIDLLRSSEQTEGMTASLDGVLEEVIRIGFGDAIGWQ